MNLLNKKFILGLTGGIACYKAAELARLLIQEGASVQVVMTQAATQFVTPITMQALSGHPVYTDQWDGRVHNNMAHIDLSRNVDAIIIAPCSADFMAQLAHGSAHDLLATLCLARPQNIPLFIAPAMNVEMWENVATQRNLKQIQNDGITVLGPDTGDQACGEHGMGRMLELTNMIEIISAIFQPKILNGKRVLITAGPTFEPIDPVRGITNRSSGKMGYALARAAYEAGAEVMLISGPTSLDTPYGVQKISVQTAQQMHDIVLSHVDGQDIFIAVAAVADWRVINASEHKIKKVEGQELPLLALIKTADILASVAALDPRPFCVGFSVETENLIEHAKEKMKQKNVPLLIGNLGPDAFGEDENTLVLLDQNGATHLPRAHKLVLARQLIHEIQLRMPSNNRHTH